MPSLEWRLWRCTLREYRAWCSVFPTNLVQVHDARHHAFDQASSRRTCAIWSLATGQMGIAHQYFQRRILNIRVAVPVLPLVHSGHGGQLQLDGGCFLWVCAHQCVLLVHIRQGAIPRTRQRGTGLKELSDEVVCQARKHVYNVLKRCNNLA